MTIQADQQLNQETTGKEYPKASIGLSEGGWVTVWSTSDGDDKKTTALSGYNSDGTLAWKKELTSSSASGIEAGRVELAALRDGSFVAVSSLSLNDEYIGTEVQRYDANGNAVGSKYTINDADQRISATGLDNGGFIIVWESSDATAYQLFNEIGAALGPSATLKSGMNDAELWGGQYPSVQPLEGGGWVVGWVEYFREEQGYGDWRYDQYVQAFNASGDQIGPPEHLGQNPYPVLVAALSNGGWVAMTAEETGPYDSLELVIRRYDEHGAAIGPTINAGAWIDPNHSEDSIDIIGLPDGGWVVARQGDNYTPVLQRYDAQGNTVGDEISLSWGHSQNLHLTAKADGGWTLTYSANSSHQSHIYQQSYDKDGNPVFWKNGAPFGDDKTITINEDTSYTFKISDFGFQDSDGDSFFGVKIMSIPKSGDIYISGEKIKIGQLIASSDISNISYIPPRNYYGSSSEKFSFKVVDSGSQGEGIIEGDGVSENENLITFNVASVNDAPTITSGGAAVAALYKISENSRGVATIRATDPDSGAKLSYSISGGSDKTLFAIDAKTGSLSFKAAPDFERPSDRNRDNAYEVVVKVSDGKLSDTQVLTVVVTDVRGKTYQGTAKINNLTGTAEADALSGGGGADTLKGGAGGDKLYGGTGRDKLYGGADADTFIFRSANDSTVATSGRDTIYDFTRGDRIDLKGIDAKTGTTKDDAFSFIDTKAFSKKAGELRYEKGASNTYIYGDINGDGKEDFTIHLNGSLKLIKGDFIL